MNGHKLGNFSKALRNLEDSQSYQPPYDAVTEAGLVSLFQKLETELRESR